MQPGRAQPLPKGYAFGDILKRMVWELYGAKDEDVSRASFHTNREPVTKSILCGERWPGRRAPSTLVGHILFGRPA